MIENARLIADLTDIQRWSGTPASQLLEMMRLETEAGQRRVANIYHAIAESLRWENRP